GGKLVAFGNACPYNPDGYLRDETFTYYGEALAIVRVEDEHIVKVSADYEGHSANLSIPVENKENIQV
ncbi:MAG: hypothetical protein J5959_08215, partial [Butyrivibrio sp.]|nr:hypothetical protein [Butyrivibrio sp.]